ncbi:hypothetical protein [Rhizobium brockwellii]|jgi:hypothetical protein|uniref:hypothetical protein n=1 Tax=Rhizobium brockwellii TaxID=3019932 RepID=UPI0005230D68|nr:hypothetical protein [Rhizobium brockwellii]KPN28049.1 hypothetical protein KS05_06870 [Rhizobium brockwellii]QJX06179.1 hypothetical protein RLCC275e_14890 [Rhizobium brockwellii]
MPLTARQVWRDFVSDGIPASGNHKPSKPDVRAWGTNIDNFIGSIGVVNSLIFSTKALLLADVAHDDNTMAWVVSDLVADNNGIYQKSGASGLGTWARVADLPYPFIPASNVGAGTPNALQATTDIPISETALVWLPIFATNTASPVTVAFNGSSPLTVKTNPGNDVVVGGLPAGMIVLGRQQGSEFRLISDQASSAIVAAAEAAADLAADYAALALNNQVLNQFAGNGSQTVFALSVDPGSKNNTLVVIDGVVQLKSSYSISGTTLTFSEAPPGDGIENNIEVSFGGKIDIGTPGSETVDADKIKATDIVAIRTKLSVYSKAEVDSAVAVSSGVAGRLYGLGGAQDAGDLNNDMTFQPGEAASAGASPVIMVLASAITKRSDAAWAVGSGNGGMDTGTKPTSAWLYWYLIKRPDTGVVDVCCSASASAPTIGGNIPAAYTKYRRIRSTKTDGSGNILADSQDGDEVLWQTAVKENGGAAYSTGTTAALVTLAGVPSAFKVRAILNAAFTSGTDTVGAFISSPDEGDQALGVGNSLFNVTNMQNASENASAGLEVRTNASGQVRHKAGAAGSLYLATRGYIDRRGRI